MYGNSIIQGAVPAYLSDIVEQSGAQAPNIIEFIIGNGTTTNYLANQGLITSSLPPGQTWKAVIIQGGTVETTITLGNPTLFLSNMSALASAYYSHSSQGLFIGHETGADHPNSSRYPSWFPDPETWLSFPQRAYSLAESVITQAHPTNPPAQTAHQGTCFANTAGYPLNLFQGDLHHHSIKGKILDACLYYTEIYGGRLCDLNVDYAVTTPLVTRLIGNGISKEAWDKLASFADRSQLRQLRPYPGSDSDFQMRSAINTTVTNLCPTKSATGGDTLNVKLVSPLGATTSSFAAVYVQRLPTGVTPNLGTIPGLQLDRTLLSILWTVPSLNGTVHSLSIPPGISGTSIWLQAVSDGPSGSSSYPLTLSDAQVIEIQ